jgi:elongation factor G
MTGGTGEFTMEFDHYEEVPGSLAQKIIKQVRGEEEEN